MNPPVLDWTAWFRCPQCGRPVERLSVAYRCDACARSYPIVLGIPDFRLYEDPLIPLADDYRKGEKLHAAATGRTFAELVAYYWTLPTYPPTPSDISARSIHHVVTDAGRIAGYARHLGQGDALLDVGCGAATLVQAMHGQFTTCIGADVGFRWLVVARHGLEAAGLPVNLVCCGADHLPFASGVFDCVASISLLEHVPSAADVISECARVTRPSGRVFVWTANRFSLAPEPHVRIWGVGFLPRRWMPAYVRWRRGMAYVHKHLLSRGELARGFARTGLPRVRFLAPVVTQPDLAVMGGAERLMARAWSVVRRVPGLGRLFLGVFPVLQAVATGRRERAS
jgi:SAM-dependent methyltransferase